MTSIFKKGTDDLKNGAVIGGLLGAAIAFGDRVTEFVADKIVIPLDWMVFGDVWTLPIYFIEIGAVAGYFVDKH